MKKKIQEVFKEYFLVKSKQNNKNTQNFQTILKEAIKNYQQVVKIENHQQNLESQKDQQQIKAMDKPNKLDNILIKKIQKKLLIDHKVLKTLTYKAFKEVLLSIYYPKKQDLEQVINK